ncbi:unnamed protein product [Vitrella brassicaformis CCMP3155]|uniref:MORN repeat protein n=1 Tax=Vitrella brassicaformis (strain CCMP3155) TaxID=1169540 RepID=A0A0G4FNE8_VITBC|nr:unnamed protein product [Vitrella brassicaformis CCMP3155]|eukprot:CEM15731.1 unnamed protein product [Vitrella brassicaformis CCMP3155]
MSDEIGPYDSNGLSPHSRRMMTRLEDHLRTKQQLIDEVTRQRDEYRKERDEWKCRCEMFEAKVRLYEEESAHSREAHTIIYDEGQYVGSIRTVDGEKLPHGTGLLRSLDGERKRYEGEWKDGKRDGKGTEYASSGPQTVKAYEGEWKDDKRHGQGKSTTIDQHGQTVYEGQWADDEMKGDGHITNLTLKDAKGQHFGLFTGPTLDGKPHGEGEVHQCGGVVYNGGWKEGKQHGQGEERIHGKVTYKGEWVKGDKTGTGVATGMNWEWVSIMARHSTASHTARASSETTRTTKSSIRASGRMARDTARERRPALLLVLRCGLRANGNKASSRGAPSSLMATGVE